VTDPNYLQSLCDRIRQIAEDCFDRRAANELRSLADKIEQDIAAGFVVVQNPKDRQEDRKV
jgi:hypothetical protein